MGAFLLVFYSAHTLYVIPSENMGTPRDTVYPWGKGAHKQKREHYCLQQYKTKRFYIKSVLFRFAFRNGYA